MKRSRRREHWTTTVDKMYEGLVAAAFQKTGESVPIQFIHEAITMMKAPGAPSFYTVRDKRLATAKLALDLYNSSKPKLKRKKEKRNAARGR